MGASLRVLFLWILLLGSLPDSFAHAPAKITGRSLPETIRGEADPNATVTTSPSVSISRYGKDGVSRGPFFYGYLARPVAGTNAFISITNKASRPPMVNVPAVSATNITQVYIPTNNYITYDEAGNTKSDGRWVYTWDAYNRLTKVESKPGAPVDSMRSLSFTYDAFGRRIGRVVSVADANGVYQESDHRKYVYHGWKLVAELNGTNNAVIRSYAWAQNMLLAIRQGYKTYIPTFDGNGNVMTLVDNQTGAIAARYEYSPYGMLLKATGPMAMENPIRYSSEYQDDVTGFIYYGYRYLNPATQTWLSRDPIGIAGGFNLYALANNDPVNGRDWLGLALLSWVCGKGWSGDAADNFEADVGDMLIKKWEQSQQLAAYFAEFQFQGGNAGAELRSLAAYLEQYETSSPLAGRALGFGQELVSQAAGMSAPATYVEGAMSYSHNVASYYNDDELLLATDYALFSWNLGAIYSGAANFDIRYDTTGQPIGDWNQRLTKVSQGVAGTAAIGTLGLKLYVPKPSPAPPVISRSCIISDAAEGGALTRVPNFANSRLAAEHYAKHVKGVVDKAGVQKVSPFGADMPEFNSFQDYVQAARKFNSGPTPSGVLEGVRANGDILRFDPATGNFGITTPQGTIRTFFRPSGGVNYFYDQFK